MNGEHAKKIKILKEYLKIGAIEVALNGERKFTWASGIKSPIYFDNRLAITHVELRNLVVDEYVQLINKHCPNAKVIAGVATSGIPWASFISQKLSLPLIYVRSQKKDHGKNKNVEGDLNYIVKNKQNDVVVIEDLISTAQSSLRVVESLREDGVSPKFIFSIFSYNLEVAQKNLSQAKIELKSIITFDDLCNVIKNNNDNTDGLIKSLIEWRDSL